VGFYLEGTWQISRVCGPIKNKGEKRPDATPNGRLRTKLGLWEVSRSREKSRRTVVVLTGNRGQKPQHMGGNAGQRVGKVSEKKEHAD